MLSRDEQLGRIIAAWTEQGVNDDTTVTEMAEVALTSLECGETHPDRRDVRCTQLPHGNGHLYHRNSELGIEWWTNGDATQTVHDVLGPIRLGQPQANAAPQGVPVPCPDCRWIRQDGCDHVRLIGGWLRCAHCGHEWNGSESRPSTWCRAKHPEFDMYCDTQHHPLNTRRHGSSTYGVQWADPQDQTETDRRGRYHTLPPCSDDAELADPAKCGAKHDQRGWCCDRDSHTVSPDDKWTWHHDRSRDRRWYLGEDIALSVAAGNEADRAVYRDLLPVLEPVVEFLNDMGKRYREGNPRMNAATCRSAEIHRDTLHDVTGKLQDLLDGPGA